MKPVNSKQRRKAFFIYVLMFVVTTSLAVLIVFFNYKVPVVENEYLLKKTEYFTYKIEAEKEFADKMYRVKNLIDTIDNEGVSREYVEQLISTELAIMRTNYASEDSSYLADMYNNIILTYLELKTAKIELQDLADTQSDIEGYVETIERLKEELSDAETDLAICRQLSK